MTGIMDTFVVQAQTLQMFALEPFGWSRHVTAFQCLGEPIQVALVESWFDEHNGFLAAHCLKDIHFPSP